MSKRLPKTLFAVPLILATGLSGISPAIAINAPVLGATGGPGTYSEQNITSTLFGDASNYRIPALADLGNNVVLAAWDGRPGSANDAPNPNSILMKRSTDGGKTWSDISYIAKGNLGTDGTQKYGYSDPSFVVDKESGKVFAFFVYSQNQGFGGSQYGNDIVANPNVIGAVVVESSDGGLTWSAPRDITKIAKQGNNPANVQAGDARSIFAASGSGIQLKYGSYKGRLIQQYTAIVKQADGSEKTQAFSLYSDDHGVTWQRGNYVGLNMDENKVVELSDGRVMLNSRDYAAGGYRKEAISTDGGQTYSSVAANFQLPDPTNNASIFRMYPDAAENSADAKKLIFTNSNNNANRDRKNLTARVSCDNGKTWPGIRQFKDGFGAYSTGTALSNGKFGVFYEASYQTDMRFGTFDEAWLNVVCAPMVAKAVAVEQGKAGTGSVTITNQESTPISGKVAYNDANGFTSEGINVGPIAPGASVTVSVPVTATASATYGKLDVVFTASDGKQSRTTVNARVQTATATPTAAPSAAPSVSPSATTTTVQKLVISNGRTTARDITTKPYKVGDVIDYTFRVTNNFPYAVNAIPSAGNFETGFLPTGTPNCRWMNLAAGGTYECKTAKHTVTQADLDKGTFTPQIVFTAVSSTDSSKGGVTSYTGDPIQLGAVSASPSASATASATASPSASAKPTAKATPSATPLPTASATTATPSPSTAIPTSAPTASLPEYQLIRFTDVKPGDTFYDEIMWIANEGITKGWVDGTYRPQTTIDRASIAAYFYRMAGSPDFQAPAVSPFKDVPTDHPFYKEIAWLQSKGITTGWSDGTFRPYEPVKRDALAAFFYRFAGKPDYQVEKSAFSDVNAGIPFYKEISWLASTGITKGWDDGTFRPYTDAKRDAVAAFVQRYEMKFNKFVPQG